VRAAPGGTSVALGTFDRPRLGVAAEGDGAIHIAVREEDNMPQANLKAICGSCDRQKSCGFAKSMGQLVLECDEHQGFQGLYLSTNGWKPGTSTRDLKLISGKDALRAVSPGDCVGLCVNCEDRDTCAFPKPPGGVWHCEEYR
jgi:hypothetical protein